LLIIIVINCKKNKMIGKIIRNWRIKKYLDYFKSDYPTTYKKLVDSKFENEKDRYIYIETLYSFYKSKYDLYKNSINCNYQHDYYNNSIYCQNLVFSKNTSGSMYDYNRWIHRSSKLEKRGWKEIEDTISNNRDLKIENIIDEW
jgi:hypothetical protein